MSKKEVPETKSKLEQLNQIEHKIADAIKNAGNFLRSIGTLSNLKFKERLLPIWALITSAKNASNS